MRNCLESRLASNRAARDAARHVFDSRLAQVRGDLDARGLGGRIADRVNDDAHAIFEEAVEVAQSNRGIIAGTIAAVAIWIFRSPIIASIAGLLGKDDTIEEVSDDQD